MKFNFKTCQMKFLSSFQNHKVGPIWFVYNILDHIKFILKIFWLRKYILKVIKNISFLSRNIAWGYRLVRYIFKNSLASLSTIFLHSLSCICCQRWIRFCWRCSYNYNCTFSTSFIPNIYRSLVKNKLKSDKHLGTEEVCHITLDY
jgi:hypothetical protein